MEEFLEKQLCENSHNYKRSLDRIIDKYSKLQYQDGGIEVDLCSTKPRTLERYMKLSKKELSKLESKSLTDLRNDSLTAQNITRDSQLDFTHQDSGADETCVSSVCSVSSVSTISTISTTQLSAKDEGMAQSDMTQLTVSSLDESQRNLSEMELQPEDRDEELEMSLRSHGSSLAQLYPSMISRIERAWHRQHVSEAAGSVLRRYRRWRQQSNKSYLNDTTFVVTLRRTNSNPRHMTSRTLLVENFDSPVKSHVTGTEAAPRSPLQQLSPGRVRGSLRGEHQQQQQQQQQQQSILVMDFSCPSETSKPKEVSLNETFTVSQLPPPEAYQLGERPSTCAVSPSRRPCYHTANASLDLSPRSKWLSLAARSPQTDGCSTYASETTAVTDRPDIYGSPVRQSLFKARMMTSVSRSPLAFSRSPEARSAERFSREPMRPRSNSTSLSSPPRRPTVPLRMLYPQDSDHSFQPQLRSPRSAAAAAAAAEGRHRLRRQISFDSSLPSIHVSYSPKKLDEDFIKLYHKFVCQSKSSFFNGPPCRFCARSSEAGRGHSSSALAALALSPHRSVLRKRHRELSWDSHPQSKRSRDEYGASSPGSKRHGKEMLRRCLSLSEYKQSHEGPSYSPSKHGMFHRFSPQQRSAEARQETWMSRGRHVYAAEFSGQGGSLESKMANGYSPRKW